MQKQMTERDKKLVVFLAMFVVIVGIGYWGLFPIIKGINSTGMEIEEAKEDKSENEMKIARLPMIEAENEEMEEGIKDSRALYFPVMTSDQVDKYMTGMILGYNLYSYDLNISMPTEEAEVSPYQYSAKAAEPEDENYSDEEDRDTDSKDKENSGTSDISEQISTGIYAVSVDMRVGGSSDDIQKLIDDLSQSEEKIHLLSYSWDSERSVSYSPDGTYEINTDEMMNMELKIYMCQE